MENRLSQQAVAFLWSLALGGALGAVYDWFRIGRILKRKRWFAVFFEDLLFALIAAISTAFCFTLTNYGQVRLFLFAGEGLGFILYYNTVGVLVVRQARAVARFLALLRRLLGQFWSFILKKLKKIMNISKKLFLFSKERCKMLSKHE